MAGALGADFDLGAATAEGALDDDVALFSESNGRFVVTVAATRAAAFEERFAYFSNDPASSPTAHPPLRPDAPNPQNSRSSTAMRSSGSARWR